MAFYQAPCVPSWKSGTCRYNLIVINPKLAYLVQRSCSQPILTSQSKLASNSTQHTNFHFFFILCSVSWEKNMENTVDKWWRSWLCLYSSLSLLKSCRQLSKFFSVPSGFVLSLKRNKTFFLFFRHGLWTIKGAEAWLKRQSFSSVVSDSRRKL